MDKLKGYYGYYLDVDLTNKKCQKKEISSKDLFDFVGGRGLGIKLLCDLLPGPGIDPLSSENPLIFMPGAFSGFPVPSSSRTCVVTKSAVTSSEKSTYLNASTVTYSNMGGFFGPEIKFAGYDGIVIRGKSKKPVYLWIKDDKVEIRDASKYWGMGTNQFDEVFAQDLRDRRFRSCYIGHAGENLVPYAAIINTAARASARGGVGCVMGSKKLKAIAISGSGQPDVAMHEKFLELLKKAKDQYKNNPLTDRARRYGTAYGLIYSSDNGMQAVKNYSEGTFKNIDKIGGITARREVWQRNYACYVCPLSCKKSGEAPPGKYAGIVHDGPEYETGTLFGANLLIDDLAGILKCIWLCDNYGLDIISTANTTAFLTEASEKGLINKKFLDGIDLKWGKVEGAIKLIHKIAKNEGIGKKAGKGPKYLAKIIGKKSEKFAIHCKGQTFAGWNCQAYPQRGLSYITSNRGACHLNGLDIEMQNLRALVDETGLCLLAKNQFSDDIMCELMDSITNRGWTTKQYLKAGERTFNLEKMFNYREGFRKVDDKLPERFFEDAYTYGPKKGAVIDRKKFDKMMNEYYIKRGWDSQTTKPSDEKLKQLGIFGYISNLNKV